MSAVDRRHRAFFVVRARDLAPATTAEIMFGLYPSGDAEDGIDTSEMAIRWHDHGRDGTPARLEVFDESWKALAGMPDVIAWLATLSTHRTPKTGGRSDPEPRPGPTPAEVVEGLKALGFEDRSRT